METNCSASVLYCLDLSIQKRFWLTKSLLFLLVALVIFFVCYYCFFRLSLANFPSYSAEFLVIRLLFFTGEFVSADVVFEVILAICKRFEKDGLCLAWVFKPQFFIYGPDNIKIISNDPAAVDKPAFYNLLSDVIGEGLVTTNGPRWLKHRKLLIPSFRFQVLRQTMKTLNERSVQIVKIFGDLSNQQSVDISPVIKLEVLKIFCESILGLSLNDEKSEEKLHRYMKLVSSLTKYSVNRAFRPWLWSKQLLFLFEDGRRYLKMYKELHDFTKEIVKEMMISCTDFVCDIDDKKVYDIKTFSNIILESHANDPSFTMNNVEAEVATFLFGGHDTSSYTLQWCLFLLGHHPEVQEKAFDEIQSVMNNNDGYISYKDLNKLKYMECIIKETLRLYPAVPILIRRPSKDIQCGKYKILKNANVFLVTFLLHRNSDVYPDPEKFDPERFDGKSPVSPWALIPFSEGIRSCIGKNFSMMEMKVILAHILRNFSITSLEKRDDVKLDWKVVLSPLEPIHFKLTRRHQ